MLSYLQFAYRGQASDRKCFRALPVLTESERCKDMKIPIAQLEPAFLGILPDKAAEEQNSTSKETVRI